MSIFFTCKVQVAGDPAAAQQTFDTFREKELTQVGPDLILWNMRPTEEAFTYLIDVEAENAVDEDEARAEFARMLDETKPVSRGLAFSDLRHVESPPAFGP